MLKLSEVWYDVVRTAASLIMIDLMFDCETRVFANESHLFLDAGHSKRIRDQSLVNRGTLIPIP